MSPKILHVLGQISSALTILHLLAAQQLGESAPLTATITAAMTFVSAIAHNYAGHSGSTPAAPAPSGNP
jgi:hypothetical protein